MQSVVVHSHWQLVVLVDVVLVLDVVVVVLVVDVVVGGAVVLLKFRVMFVILVMLRSIMTDTNGSVVFETLTSLSLLVVVVLEVLVVELVEVVVVVVVSVVVDVVLVVVVAVMGQIGGRHAPSPVKRVWYSGHEQMLVETRRGGVQESHGMPRNWPLLEPSMPASTASPPAPGSRTAKVAAATARRER